MSVDCPCEEQVVVSTTTIGLTISTSLLLMACLYLYVRFFASREIWTFNKFFSPDYCEVHKRLLEASR